MGGPLDVEELGRRLVALADAVPSAPVADRRSTVRVRARAVQRRRAGLAGVGLAAAVVLAAPLPGLLQGTVGPPPTGPAAAERTVATFAFPDQGAVAELVEVPGEVEAGQRARLVVRVRSDRGAIGGVDLTFGDGDAVFLEGRARCTPGAGPTVVELSAEHAWRAPGRYAVRAAPQVVTGCQEGLLQYSVRGTTPDSATVTVR